MREPLQTMRLVVVSHVTHYRFGGRLYAYGPYSQEIDLWADLFKHITVAAPCRDEPPPADCLPFTRGNISVARQPEFGGETLGEKLKLAVATPFLAASLARAMFGADAIHVRCPGNLGLLGSALAPLFSHRLVAKYAGQWSAGPADVWSSRWQRAILRSNWWRGPVTVYGDWPDQPKHVIPFFTSLLTTEHIDRARIAAARSWGGGPLEVLYTGRLSKAKNVDVLIRAIARTRQSGYGVRCTVIGDGVERSSLEALSRELGLTEVVQFTGGLEYEEVINRLERAHVLALVSEAEGWPKAIAEAMAFGLVTIGSARGFVPKMLGDGRGLVVEPRNEEALAAHLAAIARDPGSYIDMRRKAAEWSQRFSMEGLQNAICELLHSHWNLVGPAPAAARQAAGGVK